MKKALLANKNFRVTTLSPAIPVISSSLFFAYKLFFTLMTALIVGTSLCAQPSNDSDYTKVITERSAKIVNTLGLTDSVKYTLVLNELVNQYRRLNAIHEINKNATTAVKARSLSKEETDAAISKLEEKKMSELLQLHNEFIAHLKVNLAEDQLEKIKDGMTYRVLPVTYAAYQDMLPSLTGEQKEKIYTWLREARELAMDEGSSDDKHKVFGKYKGRINNYLSGVGYDLKKETEDWQKRIKERNAAKKESQQ